MEPFVFFSYGLTKSGSTLAFELTRVALEQAGFAQDRLDIAGLVVSRRINAIEHVNAEQAQALAQRVADRRAPVVLKTHTRADPAVVGMLAQGTARAHVVLRDPRDVALSMLDNGRTNRAAGRPAFSEIATLDDAAHAIENQIKALRSWAALPGVGLLTYDQLAFDTKAAAHAILEHLGCEGRAQAVARRVKNKSFTQLNKGIRDRHRSEMSARDSARFRNRFAAFYADYMPNVDMPAPSL